MRLVVLAAAFAAFCTAVEAGQYELETAARLNDLAAVVAELEAGTPADPPWDDDYSALMWAARHGNEEMADALLAAGADTEYRDLNGDRALLWAIDHHQVELVRLLLSAGSPADSTDDPYGNTALMDAAWVGEAGIVRVLLDAGADPNHHGQGDDTALHHAAWNGNAEIAAMLLAAGAEVDAVDTILDQAPLHVAAQWGRISVMRLLLDAGAEVERPGLDGTTALYAAAITGQLGAVATLVAAGADPDASGEDGRPAILAAMDLADAEGGDRLAVALYLAAVTRHLDEALAEALWSGRTAVALVLLARGADPLTAERDGLPVLAAAARHEGLAMLDLLQGRGFILSEQADAVLLAAASNGHGELAREALDAGAAVDVRDGEGATPLMLAARNGKVAIVDLLLIAGADPGAVDAEGRTIAELLTATPNDACPPIEPGAPPSRAAILPDPALLAWTAELVANQALIRERLGILQLAAVEPADCLY
jgi:ankyrin repeat protein